MSYLENKLNSILPEETPQAVPFNEYEDTGRDAAIAERAEAMQERKSAAELARLKANAQAKLKHAEATATRSGVPKRPDPQKAEEARQALETIEALEAERAEPLRVEEIVSQGQVPASQAVINSALKLQGASRKDINRILTSLNINTSVQLSKSDTANLLACLLTCNETQLNAIMVNKKVPVVIKTVIKRLLEDAKHGDITTIESLWDRIFGKTGMLLDLPEQTQLQTGIIPGVPVSREAYIVIRDTLI